MRINLKRLQAVAVSKTFACLAVSVLLLSGQIVQAAGGSAGGTASGGGGNAVLTQSGKVIPLDLYMAQQNSSIVAQTKFPVAYKYFQQQIEKVRVAIPSFAKDLQAHFSVLKWTLTNMDITAKTCRNNMGIYSVQVGNKVVILACQSENEVVLSAKYTHLMEKPEYLGVIFLHEAFVNQLLAEFPVRGYAEAETELITKADPYILSNNILNPEILYSYAVDFYLASENNRFNDYAIEASPARKAEFEQLKAKTEKFEQNAVIDQQKLDAAVQKFNDDIKFWTACDLNGPRFSGENAKKDLKLDAVNDYLDLINIQFQNDSRYGNVSDLLTQSAYAMATDITKNSEAALKKAKEDMRVLIPIMDQCRARIK